MIVKINIIFAVAIILSSYVKGTPVNSDNAVTDSPSKEESVISVNTVNNHETTPKPIEQPATEKASPQEIAIAANPEESNSDAEESEELLPDSSISANSFDSSVYPGLLTPDAYQHYISQYGVPPPYVPYPSPIGYAPPIPPPPAVYPSPYVVQTGYEGYLVPSTATTAPTTTTTTAATGTTTASTSILSMLNPITFFSSILSALMTSILFRFIASVISGIAMYAFGNVIRATICNFTPLCELDLINLRFLKNKDDAKDLGSMIAEGMTPERVRRATEIVHSAILKYQQLQKMMTENEDNYEKKNM